MGCYHLLKSAIQHCPSHQGYVTDSHTMMTVHTLPLLLVCSILFIFSAFFFHCILSCEIQISVSSHANLFQIPCSFHRFIICSPEHVTQPSQSTSLFHFYNCFFLLKLFMSSFFFFSIRHLTQDKSFEQWLPLFPSWYFIFFC